MLPRIYGETRNGSTAYIILLCTYQESREFVSPSLNLLSTPLQISRDR